MSLLSDEPILGMQALQQNSTSDFLIREMQQDGQLCKTAYTGVRHFHMFFSLRVLRSPHTIDELLHPA